MEAESIVKGCAGRIDGSGIGERNSGVSDGGCAGGGSQGESSGGIANGEISRNGVKDSS